MSVEHLVAIDLSTVIKICETSIVADQRDQLRFGDKILFFGKGI